MGPIFDYEDKYITTLKRLERALLEYTPKLFLDFYVNKNGELIIEVPKQIINKIKRQVVPHIHTRLGINIRVVERGKYKNKMPSFLDIFRKERL